MRFFVAVPEGTTEALAQVVEAAAEHEHTWWHERIERAREESVPVPGRRGARRAAMAQARTERAQLRAAGELVGSRDRLITHAAARVLAENAWDTDWPPIPDKAASTRGRRWGVRPAIVPYAERLSLDLDEKVGTKMREAAYWVSAEPTQHLREWYDRFGDGPAETDREGGDVAAVGRLVHDISQALGYGPRAADFRERDQWRAKILTTGHILRTAIDSVLPGELPGNGEPALASLSDEERG